MVCRMATATHVVQCAPLAQGCPFPSALALTKTGMLIGSTTKRYQFSPALVTCAEGPFDGTGVGSQGAATIVSRGERALFGGSALFRTKLLSAPSQAPWSSVFMGFAYPGLDGDVAADHGKLYATQAKHLVRLDPETYDVIEDLGIYDSASPSGWGLAKNKASTEWYIFTSDGRILQYQPALANLGFVKIYGQQGLQFWDAASAPQAGVDTSSPTVPGVPLPGGTNGQPSGSSSAGTSD